MGCGASASVGPRDTHVLVPIDSSNVNLAIDVPEAARNARLASSSEGIHAESCKKSSARADLGGQMSEDEKVAHLNDLHRAFPFKGYIDKTEHRAISLRQLWQVLHFVARRCHRWYDKRSESLLSVRHVNLYQVNEWVILPSTQPNNCAFIELLSALDQMPLWFVSHWWGEPILEFVRCLERHVTVRALADDVLYWICAYANRQHSLSQEVTVDPRESSFFKAMQIAVGVLLVLDDLATPFTRIWCAFEESVALTYTENRGSPMLLDVASCHNGNPQLITDGNTQIERQKEASLGDGGSAMLGMSSVALQIKTQREMHFPLDVICKGLEVVLESAQASQEADRVHILNCLVGRDLEASPPLTTHEKYSEVNHMLRSRFALVAWRQALEHGRAGEFALAEALASDRRRTKVTLELHSTSLTDDGLQQIAKGLHLNLRELVISLGNTCITDVGVKALADRIPGSLHELNLNVGLCVFISSTSLVALADKFPASLRRLTLNATCISESEKALAAVACKLPCGMQELELVFAGPNPFIEMYMMQQRLCKGKGKGKGGEDNDSKVSVKVPGLPSLAWCMPKSLRRLVLHFESQNWITNADLAQIALSLPSTLEELHLSLSMCEGVGNDGIQALGRGLPSSLRSLLLRLGCTAIGSAGLSELAAFMPPGLLALNLELQACDTLCDDRILALVQHLPASVEDLQLNFAWGSAPGSNPMRSEPAKGPKLGSSGIASLGHKLCRMLRVFSLNIQGCADVGPDALVAIAENLPPSLRVMKLFVGQCAGSGDLFAQALSKHLPACLDELFLDMNSSSVTDAGVAALARDIPAGIRCLMLGFSRCANVSDASVHAVAEILPSLAKLEVVNMHFQMCEVADSALEFFSSKIPSTLLEAGIHFEGCKQIRPDSCGARALRSALAPIQQRLAALTDETFDIMADDIVQNWEEAVYEVRFDTKIDTGLGMKLKKQGTNLLVTWVGSKTEACGSLVSVWNDAHPEATIRQGDIIIKVNGLEGNAKLMLDEFEQASTLVLRLLPRNFTYDITLVNEQGIDLDIIGPLGCEYSIQNGRMYITGITSGKYAGLVFAWNEANPTKQVRQGDQILKVNQVEGNDREMMAESRNASTLHLKLHRSRGF